MRVLLVEDNTMLGTAVGQALRDASSAVDWLQDGRSASTALALRAAGIRATAWIAALLLAGCAAYQSLPLPEHATLVTDAGHLQVETASMPSAALRSHRFDPGDGLDMVEVAMLAVANSPELKALRADAGVARAQAFAAGLLPDPQLALSADRAMGSPAGATTAFSAGLGFDVGALLARSSIRAAASADNRKTDLNLLWQEWQTVAKARLLFVRLTALGRSTALLERHRSELQPRLDRTRAAVERGLIGSDVATPQLTALQDVERQRNELQRQTNQARHDLNALLGLAPDAAIALVGEPDLPPLDPAQVQAALGQAARRRPDLLALQAGYAAEDARYRGALRAQFPALTIGPTRARDTSNVNTIGFTLGLTLPLFNRNRGPIAIELATRDKLRLDYQQRLDTTTGDAHRLLTEQAILQAQRRQIDAAIDELAQVAARARAAFQARNIDALTLTNAEGALLAKQLERIAVGQALWEQAIALQALVGADLIVPEPKGDATS